MSIITDNTVLVDIYNGLEFQNKITLGLLVALTANKNDHKVTLLLMQNALFFLTSDCTFADLEAIVKKADKEKGNLFCSELEIIKVNEHKAMLEQPDLKQWDINNNCKDTVYNL